MTTSRRLRRPEPKRGPDGYSGQWELRRFLAGAWSDYAGWFGITRDATVLEWRA